MLVAGRERISSADRDLRTPRFVPDSDAQLAPEDSSSEIQNNQDLGSLIALACRRLMAEASFPNFQSNCPSAMWALLVQVKRDTLAHDTGRKERDC